MISIFITGHELDHSMVITLKDRDSLELPSAWKCLFCVSLGKIINSG